MVCVSTISGEDTQLGANIPILMHTHRVRIRRCANDHIQSVEDNGIYTQVFSTACLDLCLLSEVAY